MHVEEGLGQRLWAAPCDPPSTPPSESGRGTGSPFIVLPQHGAADPLSIDQQRETAELKGQRGEI